MAHNDHEGMMLQARCRAHNVHVLLTHQSHGYHCQKVQWNADLLVLCTCPRFTEQGQNVESQRWPRWGLQEPIT